MVSKSSNLFSSKTISVPEVLNKSYLPELDGLRGIAIITVIISHAVLNTSLAKYLIGDIGVEIFFVLSGFLITTLLLKERLKEGRVSFKNFYIRRALRILPVAYLFLILLVFLNYLLKLNISSGSFFASAFYVKNLHFNFTSDWYSAHFWTLSVEEQFYIIFPLFLVYKLDSYVKVTYFLVLVIPILQFLGYNNIGIFYSNYAIHKSIFLLINLFGNGSTSILIGSLLSILMFKGLLLTKTLKINHSLSFVIFIIAIIFRVTCINFVDSTYLTSTIFSIAIALVIFLCLINNSDFLSRLLKNKMLTTLGVLSYSLYIWQQIFLYKQPWANSFKYSDSLFLNIPALFIVAYLSYHFYELKFLKLKEKFKSVGYNIDKKIL